MGSEGGAAAAGEKRPFQFTLRQLLVVMGAVCVFSAAYGWLGESFVGALIATGVIGLLGLATWFAFRSQWTEAIAVLLLDITLVLLLLPAIQSPRIYTRFDHCKNNIRCIAIALHNYHDTYGSFPPAYIADANGTPMHSWRVLILPFLEQKNLHALYDFREPWDGPNNSKLAVEVGHLKCYECLYATTPGETSYMAVVGPQTMWPGEKTTKMSDVKDGTSFTLMVVEVHNSGIHWMDPRDLDVTQMPMAINSAKGQGISSGHVKCAMAVFADGHTQALPNDLAAETLRALLTRAGGETVAEF